eukprot:TRINITY_DN10452_c0_g1_i1.p1 TRINITY_DN10452_c0_g1~~TRINITY_DN10452_c0_g1_i1.p1  ORF type:complete len:1356 (+),score=332.54 TRINITY_DN10452_c0_g1_i1:107-4174(+)
MLRSQRHVNSLGRPAAPAVHKVLPHLLLAAVLPWLVSVLLHGSSRDATTSGFQGLDLQFPGEGAGGSSVGSTLRCFIWGACPATHGRWRNHGSPPRRASLLQRRQAVSDVKVSKRFRTKQDSKPAAVGLDVAAVRQRDLKSLEGYADNGDYRSARALFDRMVAKGLDPGYGSHVAVLKSYANGGRSKEAVEWFERVVRAGFEPPSAVYSLVLRACERGGQQEEAEAWFERMKREGVELTSEAFTSVVASCILAGDDAAAIQHLLELQADPSIELHSATAMLNAVLRVVARQGDVPAAVRWFAQYPAFLAVPDKTTFRTMVETCAEAGDPDGAIAWLQSMEDAGFEADSDDQQEIIRAYVKAEDPSGAARWFNKLAASGVSFSESVYSNAVLLCARSDEPELAAQWIDRMVAAGYEPDKLTYTTLVRAWAEKNDTKSALNAFETMVKAGRSPDVFAYNALLSAYKYAGDMKGMLRQYARMSRSGVEADSRTYGLLLEAAAKAGAIDEASTWLRRFEQSGLDVADVPYDKVIQSFSQSGNADAACDWAVKGLDAGRNLGLVTYNSIIKACLNAKQSKRAKSWLKRMGPETVLPHQSTYMMFIRNSARCGSADAAADWHRKMTDDAGLTPTAESFRAVVTAYVNSAKSDTKAVAWFEEMIAAGLKPDLPTYTSIVNLFAKKGDMTGASDWFERMVAAGIKPDVKAYTTLIMCCARQRGGATFAARWLDWMIAQGVEPDAIAYNIVLGSHARAGDMGSAAALTRRMKDSGMRPSKESYDLLLKGCVKHRNLRSAEKWLAAMAEDGVKPDAHLLQTIKRHRGVRNLRFDEEDGQDSAMSASDEDDEKDQGEADAADLEPAEDSSERAAAAKMLEDIQAEGSETADQSAAEILQTFAKQGGSPRMAAALFYQLQETGHTADAATYQALINCCVEARQMNGAIQWLEKMTEESMEADDALLGSIIHGALQLGGGKASNLLGRVAATAGDNKKKLRQRYDFMVQWFSRNGRLDLADQWYEKAAAKGLRLRKLTCLAAARACVGVYSDNQVLTWMRRSIWEGEKSDIPDERKLWQSSADVAKVAAVLEEFLGGVIYQKDGRPTSSNLPSQDGLDAAMKWVDRTRLSTQWLEQLGLTETPALPYAGIAVAHTQLGRHVEAAAWFDKAIASGLKPLRRVFYVMMDACGGDTAAAAQWFERLSVTFKAKPQAPAYASVLRCACRACDTAAADAWFDRMITAGRAPNLPLYRGIFKLQLSSNNGPAVFKILRTATDTFTNKTDLPKPAGMTEDVVNELWERALIRLATREEPDHELLHSAASCLLESGLHLKPTTMGAVRKAVGPERLRQLCEELGLDIEMVAGSLTV